LEPWLAESYEVDEAAPSITFKLRPGITFHDGEPFNAEAVVANLSRLIDPDINSPKAVEFEQLTKVEAVDDSTVKLTLSAYAPAILSSLAHDPGLMVSPRALREQGEDYGKTNAVGTGPFKF